MSLAEMDASLAATFEKLSNLKTNLAQVILGKSDVIDFILMSLLTGESILVEDVPGVGKTTLARALAASLDLEFQRVQCTPDLLPTDIFGFSVFNPQNGTFHFRKGPVFCNILLVDEINRASPRTQSALLEVMAEGQVTIEGETHPLQRSFLVIATQNPLGFRGTFPLPESQLDRFLMKISMEYPDRNAELKILYQESSSRPLENLESVLSLDEVISLQDSVRQVGCEESVAKYLLDIVDETRSDPRIELGCSPRGAISFFKAAKANAVLKGRGYVLPDDIQLVAPCVLQHRIAVSQQQNQSEPREIISEIISRVHVPV